MQFLCQLGVMNFLMMMKKEHLTPVLKHKSVELIIELQLIIHLLLFYYQNNVFRAF